MRNLKLHGIEDIIHREGQLSYIGIGLSKKCNLNCLYCFEGAGKSKEPRQRLSLNQKKDILNEAKELGAQSMLIAGEGEPFLDKDLKPLLEHANYLELISVVYSNGTKIDSDTAKFLYRNNVTPVIKLESLNPQTHDFLTNVEGSHESAMKAIETLTEVGYHEENSKTRLGIATVYTNQNLHEIPKLFQWAEDKGIKAYGDILSITGRAKSYEELIKPELEQIFEIQKLISSEACVNKREPCIIWKYGIIIGNTGEAKYCTAVNPQIGNIYDHSLKELLERKNELYPAKTGDYTCPVKEAQYFGGKK